MMKFVSVCLLLAVLWQPGSASDSLFYGTEKTLISLYVWGYISGTNGYLDIGKYQRFEWTAFEDRYLVAARLYFGFKSIVGDPDTVWVVVRGPGGNGGPGTLVESVPLTTDKLDTTGAGNLVAFANPVKLQGLGFLADTVFVGIEWNEWQGGTSDTFALFSDPDGFGDRGQRVWERISYGTPPEWVMWPWINSPDASYEWNVDSDLWISALLSPAPTSVVPEEPMPTDFQLYQNYPNPFNPTTEIRYQVSGVSNVKLVVYDILGREVSVLVDGRKEAGVHEVSFDARALPSGTYVYRLQADGVTRARTMMLLE